MVMLWLCLLSDARTCIDLLCPCTAFVLVTYIDSNEGSLLLNACVICVFLSFLYTRMSF